MPLRFELAVVWGASGFVGSQLVDTLSAAGWRVRALVRDLDSQRVKFGAEVDTRSLDMRAAPAEMRAALEGATVVFHCAGHGEETPASYADFVAGTAVFAETAKQVGARRYFQLSTVAVYGARSERDIGPAFPIQPRTAYARSRAAAEQVALEIYGDSPGRCTVVRFPMVVGPAMRSDALRSFFRALRLGVFLHPGEQDAALNCIGIRRLAANLVALAEMGPPVPRICQFADNVKWTNIAAIYARESGRSVSRIPIPGRLGRAAVSAMFGISVLGNRATFRNDAAIFTGVASPDTETEISELVRSTAGGPVQGGLISVTAVNLCARAGAGLLPLVVAWQFGATAVTDALFWVFSAVLFLGGAFSNALETVAVPWASRRHKNATHPAWLSAPSLIAVGIALAGGLIFYAANTWMMQSGLLLSGQSAQLAEAYLDQSALAIVFMMLAGLWSGVLLAHSAFVLPAVSLSLKWWGILVMILLLDASGHTALLGFSFLIGEVLRIVPLFAKIRFELALASSVAAWRAAAADFPWRGFAFTFLSVVSLHVNPMIDRLMASWLGNGAVSLFEYAWTISLAPAMIFTSGYLIIWYTEISKSVGLHGGHGLAQNVARLRRYIWVYSGILVFAVWAGTLALLEWGGPIGRMSRNDVTSVCEVLLMLTLGLPFALLNVGYARLLTALNRAPVVLTVVVAKILLNVAGNVLLIESFGLVGLAASTVVAEALSSAAFMLAGRRSLRARSVIFA